MTRIKKGRTALQSGLFYLVQFISGVLSSAGDFH